MPAFFSPIANPNDWAMTVAEEVTIPAGLRYSGYKFRGILATQAAPASIASPALGILRKVTSGDTFIEVQVNPFPIRSIASALPWGVPTFYLMLSDASGLLPFNDFDTAPGNEPLGTAAAITIICAGQDRAVLDPALWSSQITDAINAGGGDASDWQPFAARVASQINTGPSAPVLLLNHAGQPLTQGSVDIILPGDPARRAILAPEDKGDLQKTVARMNAADPTTMNIANLLGNGSLSDSSPGSGRRSIPFSLRFRFFSTRSARRPLSHSGRNHADPHATPRLFHGPA